MLKKNVLFFALLFLVAALMSGCGNAEPNGGESSDGDSEADAGEKITLSVGTMGPETSSSARSLDFLHEELQKQSDGRIGLEIFANSALGNEAEMFQQVQAGTLDIASISAGELNNHSDAFTAWYLPELFGSIEDTFAMLETEESMALYDTLDNVVFLGHGLSETRTVVMPKPFKKLSDIQGVKMRVLPNPIQVAWWEKLGASPTPIPMSEVYTAFQTGVIDGVDSGIPTIIQNSWHEMGKHFTPFFHAIGVARLINEGVWESLSESDQQIIKDAMKKSDEYWKELVLEDEEKALEMVKEVGGELHEIEDRNALEEKAIEFRKKYLDDHELIQPFVEKALEIKSAGAN